MEHGGAQRNSSIGWGLGKTTLTGAPTNILHKCKGHSIGIFNHFIFPFATSTFHFHSTSTSLSSFKNKKIFCPFCLYPFFRLFKKGF
jgi:hypothetical protein